VGCGSGPCPTVSVAIDSIDGWSRRTERKSRVAWGMAVCHCIDDRHDRRNTISRCDRGQLPAKALLLLLYGGVSIRTGQCHWNKEIIMA